MKLNQLQTLKSEQIKNALANLYPKTSQVFDISKSENLFSPFHIELPISFYERISIFNQELNKLYKLKFNLLKQNQLKLKNSEFQNQIDVGKLEYVPQVLSCLDFHIDLKTNDIRLIEANTNASGYLIGSLVYQIHNMDFSSLRIKLLQMLKVGQLLDCDLIFMADQEPKNQKMYLEFLLYQEFLNQNNKTLEIIDIYKLNENINNLVLNETNKSIGIYNRSTDFYLTSLKDIRQNYLNHKIQINPQPIGYDLWAHKDNLNDWMNLMEDQSLAGHQINFDLIKSFILQSQSLQNMFTSLEDAWSKRKNYFFKPSDSYGGKATYKGSSISKKYFENAWSEDFLAQDYFPASKFLDDKKTEWKFDLRVYVFEDQILFPLARVYQGQITNFSKSGGGFAPVTFY